MTQDAKTIRSEELSWAISFAAKHHARQTDKQGEPYILHPLRVMTTLRKEGHPLHVQMAGVLHDVVEDTDVTLGKVRSLFGGKVALLVDLVSRRGGETYPEYIDRLVSDAAHSQDAVNIKLADLKDNLRVDRFTPDAPYERMIKTLRRLKENT